MKILKRILIVIVAPVIGAYAGSGMRWHYYTVYPKEVAGVLVEICPTQQIGVLWFMSDGKNTMEWIEPGSPEAALAYKKSQKLPADHKDRLIIPCQKMRTY